jgi:hypothetical protein
VTVHYESVMDKQWPDSNQAINLKMRHLDYILIPNGSGTQVIILSAMEQVMDAQAWIVNMSSARSPVDWCAELAKAAKDLKEGTLKAEVKTSETRGSTNPLNYE